MVSVFFYLFSLLSFHFLIPLFLFLSFSSIHFPFNFFIISFLRSRSLCRLSPKRHSFGEPVRTYSNFTAISIAYTDSSGGCFPLQHDLCIIFDLVFDILPHSCFLLFIFTPFFGSLAYFFFIFCFSFFLPFFLFFPSSFNQRLCESRKKVYGINAYYTMYARVCESSNIFCSLFVIGAKLGSTLPYQISSLTLRPSP